MHSSISGTLMRVRIEDCWYTWFVEDCGQYDVISSTGLDNEQGHRWERKRLGGHVRKDLWNSVEEHGRRLRGDWGDSPPKFEAGDGPCIRPPYISRSSFIGWVGKYEVSKKKCQKEFF